MTDETLEQEEEQASGPAQLRDRLQRSEDDLQAAQAEIERLKADSGQEVAVLEEQIRAKAFEDLGLDPEHGIGRAAAISYGGPAEGLAEFVGQQFDWFGPEPLATAGILSAQGQLDEASTGSGSVSPPSRDDVLAQAEAARDNDETMRIKGAQIASWFEGPG